VRGLREWASAGVGLLFEIWIVDASIFVVCCVHCLPGSSSPPCGVGRDGAVRRVWLCLLWVGSFFVRSSLLFCPGVCGVVVGGVGGVCDKL
jgi:hypothetical protein